MLKTLVRKWGVPFFRWGLGPFVVSGLLVAIVRLVSGLGPTTALSDSYPWGLWIGFDVFLIPLSGVAFTLSAVVYIFNLERYHSILRPAILTGFLGYIMVLVLLLMDLGRWDRFWHFLVFWNPHSPMFEVAFCILLYTCVLVLELSPLVFERFNMAVPLRLIRAITIPVVIAGVVLSTMHQSSLGSLFVIVPGRLHGLWYTPLLPLLFLVSAVAAGLAMVIFISFFSGRVFRHGPEISLLSGLGRIIPFVLGFYFLLKVVDLAVSGELGLMFQGSLQSNLFLVEIVGGVILPGILLASPRVRGNTAGLLGGALLIIGGLFLNRFGILLIGLKAWPGASYFPHWIELSITVAIVSAGVIAYALVARFFPLFAEHTVEAS